MTKPLESTYDAQSVIINGQALSEEKLTALEKVVGTLSPGTYWYDATSGAWGMDGGPTVGFTLPNLEVPQPMRSDCSGGGTGTWFNGREIHEQDRSTLIQLFGVCLPGRFWLDAMGNLGPEGFPPIANLRIAMQRTARSQEGGLVSGLGGTVGSDGQGGLGFFARNSDGTFTSWSN